MRRFITGDKELDAVLSGMKTKAANKIAAAALGGALSTIAAGIRRAAPQGQTRALRDSIKGRFEKGRGKKGKYKAKAGVNVGKMTAARKAKLTERWGDRLMAPHAHLVGLGTKPRFRKKLGGRFRQHSKRLHEAVERSRETLKTGTMPSNDFVLRGMLRAKAKAFFRSRARAAKALSKYVNSELKRMANSPQ